MTTKQPTPDESNRQHEEQIRLHDIGQPKVLRVTFTVSVEMTDQQRDGYSSAHGVDFVSLEVRARFPREATEALKEIPWVRDYARVRISDPKIEKG